AGELEVGQPTLAPLLGRAVAAEVMDDRARGVPELLDRPAGADLHQAIFSRGAYSSISRRSAPSSAKRTVTTPPGSTRTTTPSPSVPWRTESPVASDGISGRETTDRSGRP